MNQIGLSSFLFFCNYLIISHLVLQTCPAVFSNLAQQKKTENDSTSSLVSAPEGRNFWWMIKWNHTPPIFHHQLGMKLAEVAVGGLYILWFDHVLSHRLLDFFCDNGWVWDVLQRPFWAWNPLLQPCPKNRPPVARPAGFGWFWYAWLIPNQKHGKKNEIKRNNHTT